jgi:hypothetical protein
MSSYMNVIQAVRRSDPVDVTVGPTWGFNEDGTMWSVPGDTHRRFIPGVVYCDLTLENGEVVSWNPDEAIPERVRWDGTRWRRDRREDTPNEPTYP